MFYRMIPNEFNEESALITCKCGACEHHLEFVYFDDDEDRYDLIVHFRLVARGFFNRLWVGIKYIFGYKSRYGDFDEMILGIREVEHTVEFLNEWIDKCKKETK